MSEARHYLACDLGAESGRVIAGSMTGGAPVLQELHRFPNVPVKEERSLTWNIPQLILEIKEGLRKAAATGLRFESISTDSWGVDYLLVDEAGEFMPPAYNYRDPRSRIGVDRVFAVTDWPHIFFETGIQFMPINTLFQLCAEDRARLDKAKVLLGVGDAVNFFLSGTPRIEVSMASTFQLYNPREQAWSDRLIDRVGLPRRIFPEIVPSGTKLGMLRPELAKETGLEPIPVIATCSHDTGAAVAGVPAAEEQCWAYISSGTWSLMGVELKDPIVNDEARELNFTNEIGFGNSVRLLKNLSGLWLIQQCRKAWAAAGREFDYARLTELASQAAPFASLINPMADEFIAPDDMTRAMAAYCARTNQPAPASEGAFIRCALESLALLYRRTLGQLERLIRRRIEVVHIVGGGSQNDLLNQFAANALERPVLAGPVEATAAGNMLMQAIALGHIPSLAEGRRLMRASIALRPFQPSGNRAWEEAAARFEKYF